MRELQRGTSGSSGKRKCGLRMYGLGQRRANVD